MWISQCTVQKRKVSQKIWNVHDKCPWFDSRQRQEICLFCEASSQVLGLVKGPVHWVSEDLSPGTKRSAREAHRSPPYALIARKRKLDLYLP